MTPEQQAALDKIKKLLRMKRGGTPDEISTALRLAQELAEKHGIDLSDVNADDETEHRERPLGHQDTILGARVQWECKYAMLLVQIFFNVNPFLNTFTRSNPWRRVQGITFVGTELDRQIATYVYGFLVGHMRREWRTKRGRCRNRQAFMYGMYLGIHSKLRERQPKAVNQAGLVLVDRALARRDKYVEDNFGALRDVETALTGNAEKAKLEGWLAGRDTEIRSGLGSTNPQGQQLLA